MVGPVGLEPTTYGVLRARAQAPTISGLTSADGCGRL